MELSKIRLLCCVLLLRSPWCFAAAELSNYNALYDNADVSNRFDYTHHRVGKDYIDLVAKDRPIHMDRILGVPTFLWTSRADAQHNSSKAAVSPRDVDLIAREHLTKVASLYRLNNRGLASARIKYIHDTGSGCIIAKFRQVVNGFDVFCLELNVAMNRNLELICIGGCLSPNIPLTDFTQADFKINARESIATAFYNLTNEGLHPSWLEIEFEQDGYHYFDVKPAYDESLHHRLRLPIRVKQVLFQMPENLEPAYYIELNVSGANSSDSAYYSYVISAMDGKLLFRHNLISQVDFSYTVFADATESLTPFDGPIGHESSPHPAGKNDHFVPPFVSPNSLILKNLAFSRDDPWLTPNATETNGNNVDAFIDLVAPQGFNATDIRATTNRSSEFDYTYDPHRNPDANRNQRMAAVVNAFYVTNFLHDWFYDAGFDESAGNAQKINFGRGGLANDVLSVRGQRFGQRNNAFMATPSDGASPTMQLLIFDDPTILDPDGYTTVVSPSDIAGDYPARISQSFGPMDVDVTGDVVIVDDGVEITTDACEDIVNGAELVGKIALIDRRVCFFVEKVVRAQNEGAIGVIIVNNAGPSLPPLGGSDPRIVIPTMGIGEEHGKLLKDTIKNGIDVTVRLHKEVIQEIAIDRDSMMDNTVIAHEWAHYMSCRLIGDANGLGNSQGSALGEGWSDFVSLLMAIRPEDALVPTNRDFSGVYAVPGAYLTGDAYFGFRRYPYSTDVKKNPLLFRHIEDDVALPDPGNGGPPTASGQTNSRNSGSHNSGEVWCTMLWECYASLLNDSRYTFEEAQDRMKAYLVASFKLTPPNPTYTEARDALLAVADVNDHDDFILFSAAFAKRGMGVDAVSPSRSSIDHSGVVESFEAAKPNARLQFVNASLIEGDNNCDSDGILDVGETGQLVVTLKNTGLASLSNTVGTVVSTTPIKFADNGNIIFPNSTTSEEIVGSVEATLLSPLENDRHYLEFTLSYSDTNAGVATKFEPFSFRANIDVAPNQAKTDDVENGSDAWELVEEEGVAGIWRVEALSTDNHAWFGENIDEASDQSLISPALEVGSSGSFSVFFLHRYAFEPSNMDGGVIELSSDNGASWTDIGDTAAGRYGGVLDATNPIGGRPAYVNTSPGYPDFVEEAIHLGDEYNGETVRIRFRLGSNGDTSAIGWHIDNIRFQGITNLPFNESNVETEFCGFCGNVFYDSNTIAGAASFEGRDAGDPDRMFGVLFDPADFGFSNASFITEVCVSNQLDSGVAWRNKLFIYPDNNGVPDDQVILGEGFIATGDGAGPSTLTFSTPVAHRGRFWVMNRGDPSVSDEIFNLEFDRSPGTRSYASETGISGLQRQDELNYHIRVTLLDPTLVSFSNDISIIEEDASIHPITLTLFVINGETLESDVSLDVIDTGDGTAEPGADYNFPSQRVTFQQGSPDGASISVDLLVINDDILEGDETIRLKLENISGPAEIDVRANTHKVAITDYMISLQTGWNLVSLPIAPIQNIDILFNDVSMGNIYAWRNNDNRSFFEVQSKNNIPKAMIGYWVYAHARKTIHFPARSLQNNETTSELHPGWNLFGPANAVANPYNQDIKGLIWFWEGNRLQPVDPSNGKLEVGKGYWINSAIKQTYPLTNR